MKFALAICLLSLISAHQVRSNDDDDEGTFEDIKTSLVLFHAKSTRSEFQYFQPQGRMLDQRKLTQIVESLRDQDKMVDCNLSGSSIVCQRVDYDSIEAICIDYFGDIGCEFARFYNRDQVPRNSFRFKYTIENPLESRPVWKRSDSPKFYIGSWGLSHFFQDLATKGYSCKEDSSSTFSCDTAMPFESVEGSCLVETDHNECKLENLVPLRTN